MSRKHVLGYLVTVVLLGWSSVQGLAQEPPGEKGKDLLDQVRRLNDLKAQKIEADVRDSLREAERIGKTDPLEAVNILKGVLINLEEDLSLAQSRRETLINSLRVKIRQWSTEVGRSDSRQPERPARVSPPTAPTRQDPPPGGSEDPIRRAADRIKSTSDRVAESKGLINRGNAGVNETGLDIARSSVLPKEPVDFPAGWRERINRPGRQKSRLSVQEQRILDALRKPIQANFSKDRFEDVLDYLQKASGVTIILDKSTLDEAGASYDSPITMRAQEVSFRTALRKVLGEVGLTYIIKDGELHALTPQRAKDMLVTRTYDVADLVGVVDWRLGPLLGQAQMIQNINALINMIQSTIEPASWDVGGRGGSGTIVFFPGTMSLIVKNTAEVHYMLGGAFR